jgi:NTE family protein
LFHTIHDVRHNINSLWDQLPERLRNTPEAKFLYNFGCVTTMDIVELIYRPSDPQGPSKDYEFSRATMRSSWAQGVSDAQRTLLASPWLAPMPPEVGARTFDVLKDLHPEGGPGRVGFRATEETAFADPHDGRQSPRDPCRN